MLNIGCHLSSSKGYLHMGKEALSIGANTFQYFTRNPRGSKAKAVNLADIAAFNNLAEQEHFSTLVAHAPYTLNLCSADEGLREFAVQAMTEDLATMEYLPGNLYNFHPGSHVKQGTEIGIQLIAQGLNRILRPDQHTTVLLETMAGKGSEVGRTFEELRAILDWVELTDKMGVCLDTCHVFDAGYDIVDHLESVLEEFDKVIGLGRLRAIHLNDSLNPLGSHKDRHAKIGQGHIGLPALTKIINHPVLCTLPFELETPNDLNGYAEEIRLLEEVFQGG